MAAAAELEDGALHAAAPQYDAALGEIINALAKLPKLKPPAMFFEGFAGTFDLLAETLGDSLLASYLLACDQRSDVSGQFADPVETGFDVPPQEAIDYFRRKKVVTPKQFDKLAAEARAAAFTVGGIYRKDVLGAFKTEIERALETGETQRETIKRFRAILDGAGQEQLGAFHLETICNLGLEKLFRFNMRAAYYCGLTGRELAPSSGKAKPTD